MRALVIRAFCALCLFAVPAMAQISEPDRAELLNDAFERLLVAADAEEAREIEARIWSVWIIGPDAELTTRLERTSTLIHSGKNVAAAILLDGIIADYPDFTEAWNRRAFARYLAGDPQGSLADIAETLKREPRHFGALAGRADIEMGMGEAAKASKTMGEVGKVHPWMARQSLIPADPPPPAPPARL